MRKFAPHSRALECGSASPASALSPSATRRESSGSLSSARSSVPPSSHGSPVSSRNEEYAVTGFVRRVVTGHDATGKAVVISDGLTPTLKTNPLRPGHRSTEIWRTDAVPAPIAHVESDPTVDRAQTIHPTPRGTVVRIAEWAPEPEAIRSLTPDQARAIFRAMGNEQASTYGRGGRHPIMHR